MNQADIFLSGPLASARKLHLTVSASGFSKCVHNPPDSLDLSLCDCGCIVSTIKVNAHHLLNSQARRLDGADGHNMPSQITQCVLHTCNFYRTVSFERHESNKFLVVNQWNGIDRLNGTHPVIYRNQSLVLVRGTEQFNYMFKAFKGGLYPMLTMSGLNHGQCHSFPLACSHFGRCKPHGAKQGSRRADCSDPIRRHCGVHARPGGGAVAVIRRSAQGDHQGRPSKPGQPFQHKFPYQKEILSLAKLIISRQAPSHAYFRRASFELRRLKICRNCNNKSGERNDGGKY